MATGEQLQKVRPFIGKKFDFDSSASFKRNWVTLCRKCVEYPVVCDVNSGVALHEATHGGA